ncbi:MAG: hypothetical protein M0T80_05645, partial [Actinomycetota bacterium]|nr:hypothetical protein [Actinomycetota bacterium]
LRAERDLTRVAFRDLDHFPDLLAEVAEGNLQRSYTALTAWLRANGEGSAADWEAMAAVLAGAIANYWTVTEVFAAPPARVNEDRFVAAWVSLARLALDAHRTDTGEKPAPNHGRRSARRRPR